MDFIPAEMNEPQSSHWNLTFTPIPRFSAILGIQNEIVESNEV